MRRLLICLCTFLCLLPCAVHADAQLDDVVMRIGENGIRYPQFAGNQPHAAELNSDLLSKAGISSYMVELATLGSDDGNLNVDYQVLFNWNDLFSVLFSASGKQPDGHTDTRYTALAYDLETGLPLTLDLLFSNPDWAADELAQQIEREMTANDETYQPGTFDIPLTEVPFTVDADGITFWYGDSRFVLEYGTAAAFRFWPEEIRSMCIEDETAPPARLDWFSLPPDEGSEIRRHAEAGTVPHMDIALGDPMSEIVEAYELFRTPDLFPGGRYYQMKAPQFRSVYLISDSMTDDWQYSVLEGIQLRRGGLYSLLINQAKRSEWLFLLGEPDESVTLTESMAQDYQLPYGSYDVYRCGTNELRLYADAEQILTCIQISR